MLEPRRPEASELGPSKSGRSLVNENIEYETERKPLFILTPPLQKSKELSVLDQPIFVPLRAQPRPDLWDLPSEVEMADFANPPCNHIEAPSTKASVSSPREDQSVKLLSPLSLHEPLSCHLPDPKDFQHMVNSIVR